MVVYEDVRAAYCTYDPAGPTSEGAYTVVQVGDAQLAAALAEKVEATYVADGCLYLVFTSSEVGDAAARAARYEDLVGAVHADAKLARTVAGASDAQLRKDLTVARRAATNAEKKAVAAQQALEAATQAAAQAAAQVGDQQPAVDPAVLETLRRQSDAATAAAAALEKVATALQQELAEAKQSLAGLRRELVGAKQLLAGAETAADDLAAELAATQEELKTARIAKNRTDAPKRQRTRGYSDTSSRHALAKQPKELSREWHVGTRILVSDQSIPERGRQGEVVGQAAIRGHAGYVVVLDTGVKGRFRQSQLRRLG